MRHGAAGTDTCSVLWQVAGGLQVYICFTLNERLTFCLLRGRAEGAMRTMTVEKLLKGMPILQGQIDALLDFEVSDSC